MIIRPRLTDHYGLAKTQVELDFAIPFLDEDIPLYLDPFLLWKSPSFQDNSLHLAIINSFNKIGQLYKSKPKKAITILQEISECSEVGLGNSRNRQGKKIGSDLAEKILSVFTDIPQINKNGILHLEEIQLLINHFSKDRVSDISCNLIKSFLIDYTIQQCNKYNLPLKLFTIEMFDERNLTINQEKVTLPYNPSNNTPIIILPKRWLRYIPWINYDDYFRNYTELSEKLIQGEHIERIEILEYNRRNYDLVLGYIQTRELKKSDCSNDPLFSQIPVLSAKRKFNTIKKLPTGKTDNADIKYEDNLCPLLASLLYPQLDFAQEQSRTDSGVQIRDLIFYNNKSHRLLSEVYCEYDSKQIVFELKNVKVVESIHINQLNRYLSKSFGNFGIIFTRNKPPKKIMKNIIDLWSGQRKCILIFDDQDLNLMCQIYENKQRDPIDVINKKYREFQRACPG